MSTPLLRLKSSSPQKGARPGARLRAVAALLRAAEESAGAVSLQAARSAQTVFEDAAKRGFRCGLDLLAAELRRAELRTDAALESAAELLTRLVYPICEKVLGEALKNDPSILRRQVEDAIAGLERPPAAIALNPADSALFSTSLDSYAEVRWSESIPPQTARIECGSFVLTVDAGAHLRRIERSMAGSLEQVLAQDLEALAAE